MRSEQMPSTRRVFLRLRRLRRRVMVANKRQTSVHVAMSGYI